MDMNSTTTSTDNVEALFASEPEPKATQRSAEKIGTEDLLRLENAALKIEKAQRMIADAQREIDALGQVQRSITARYGIDPDRDRVQMDGTIVRAS